MNANRVCVIGGTGFVGRHVVHLLAAQGRNVLVPTRGRERAKHLIVLPTVDVVEANVHDETALMRLVKGMDAVVNLVGVLHDARGERGFGRAHVDLPRNIIKACVAHGVRRLVHMSALQAAPDGPSRYLRTKGEAEQLVRASALDWTIFRPSVIFGPGDSFLNQFAQLSAIFPVIALPSPGARFQPVYVSDVARAFARSLAEVDSVGRTYDLCGPKVYTLRELVALVGALTGRRRPIIGLNDSLSYVQAWAMEFLPMKMMTRDNYYSMRLPNVCECPFPFGIAPKSLEEIAPTYLARDARHDVAYRSLGERQRERRAEP
jgi:NADH dehydrogenase